MKDRFWHAGLTAVEFNALRGDPRLPSLLALARLSNALSLAHHGLSISLRWQNPRSVKERTSAILYAAGVLHEGLIVAESLAKDFRHLTQYREGFAPILADPGVKLLRTRFLKPLRDKSVFHFDRSVSRAAIDRIDAVDDVVFLSGGEPNAAGIYYILADDLTIHHLIGEYRDQSKFLAALEAFMEGTADLFKRFTVASQRLLPAAFRQLGVRRLKPRR